ncbi:spore germination protein [Halalkalibacter akibai]|uniref:Spore germination protein n=1 Tax=Halalkalibacter akibai (strain ATCC 43226 / DSM 21942 / CIP 109018 / JCM 9157 / 1139) TaxID=1236973 RepID=W4QU77_HALA3|nr:spore germination protein [Halalkalibacter akibai]GAE35442.1 spore germination protein [Halalkalibacter akibai JCM 9157]
MPSIVTGPLKVNSNDGVMNFGDSLNISPKSTSKSVSGSGGGISGDFIITNNGFNINNVADPDLIDQNQSANI